MAPCVPLKNSIVKGPLHGFSVEISVGQELAASQQTKLDQALSEAQSREDHET